jgi:hypothetical protein
VVEYGMKCGPFNSSIDTSPHLVLRLQRAASLQWLGVWAAVAGSPSTTPAQHNINSSAEPDLIAGI